MKIAKQTSYCINVLSPIFFLCSISIVSNASPNPPVWLYYPNQGDNQQVGSHHSVGKKAKCAARTSGCASAQPHLPESSLCRLEKNFPLLSQKMWWLTYVPYYEIQTFKNRCAIPNSVTLKKKKKDIWLNFSWRFHESQSSSLDGLHCLNNEHSLLQPRDLIHFQTQTGMANVLKRQTPWHLTCLTPGLSVFLQALVLPEMQWIHLTFRFITDFLLYWSTLN